MSLPRRSHSSALMGWDERVAREVQHQARIETAFDRADALDRLGDTERALEWLDKAGTLSGGLSPAYRAKRVRLVAEVGESRWDA